MPVVGRRSRSRGPGGPQRFGRWTLPNRSPSAGVRTGAPLHTSAGRAAETTLDGLLHPVLLLGEGNAIHVGGLHVAEELAPSLREASSRRAI